MVQLVRGRRDWKFAGRWNCGLALVWIASYAVFLFFWLPQNTFYKLFLLPPVFYVAGCVLARYAGPRRYRLALFTAAVALSNLTLSIYPYTHAAANVALTFAHNVGRLWSDKTVVFYEGYGPDDWTIRYFNPHTTWIRLWGHLDWPEREAAKGKDVWLDTTASDLFPPDRLGPGQQVVTSKNRIRFFRYSASSASLR
jgi:hypothetical protein